MNNNGNGSKNRFMMGLHSKGRKERDNEDLHLFRDLHKRDKERTACLLLPVDDLEHNNGGTGNSQFYRIQSIKKESGFGLLSEGNQSDLDWLKTPPATPLFPSLEMEAIAPHMKQTPVAQPLAQRQSQLQISSNSEATKISKEIEKSPTTKPKIPSRSITPSHRPRNNPSIEPKNPKRTTTTPSPKTTQASSTNTALQRNNNNNNNNMKSTNHKENYLTANLSKAASTNMANPKPKSNPRSRPTSPIVRSTIASQIPEFSNETPPNLRTDRSSSVTRGRKSEAAMDSRRQSCSPSVTRGRKVEAKPEGGDRRRTESTNIVGSRMVERMMNARKGNGNEGRDLKERGPNGNYADFGGLVNKTSAHNKTTLTQLVRKK